MVLVVVIVDCCQNDCGLHLLSILFFLCTVSSQLIAVRLHCLLLVQLSVCFVSFGLQFSSGVLFVLSVCVRSDR